MALTLLQMTQRALREKAQFSVPATIVSNTDPTAVRLLNLADRTGRALKALHAWQAMNQTYTFPTVASTGTYALPSDFQRFLNLTQWDRTNYTNVRGPVSAAEWEVLRSGNLSSASTIPSFFRIAAGVFAIYPTPSDVRTIAYQYIGTSWIVASGGSSATKEYFTVDTDTCIFDDDLMVLGIKERMEAVALGIDFVPSPELNAMTGAAIAADGGKGTITFGPPASLYGVLGGGNLPVSDFG